MQLKKMFRSFLPALKGIAETLRDGNNFRVQILCGILACIVSYFLKIQAIEWCIIIICIVMVLGAELMNTSIELLVDKITLEKEEWARKTKDNAAGAVLIIAIGTCIIASIIWIPYILKLL